MILSTDLASQPKIVFAVNHMASPLPIFFSETDSWRNGISLLSSGRKMQRPFDGASVPLVALDAAKIIVDVFIPVLDRFLARFGYAPRRGVFDQFPERFRRGRNGARRRYWGWHRGRRRAGFRAVVKPMGTLAHAGEGTGRGQNIFCQVRHHLSIGGEVGWRLAPSRRISEGNAP